MKTIINIDQLVPSGTQKTNNYEINLGLNDDEIILISDKTIEELCLTINVAKNASIKMIEKNLGKANIIINIAENAWLHYLNCNTFDNRSNKEINVYNNANLNFSGIYTNSANESIIVNLLEENANAELGFLVINNEKNSEMSVNVFHKAKHTNSSIMNNGVAIANANLLFNCTGKIMQGMSQSNCRQLTKGVIVEDNSSILARPILLIDEYDVNAYHGASIGKMSDEDLFYLMSRGLTKTEAFKLMLTGVINPFISKIFDEEIKSLMEMEIYKLV